MHALVKGETWYIPDERHDLVLTGWASLGATPTTPMRPPDKFKNKASGAPKASPMKPLRHHLPVKLGENIGENPPKAGLWAIESFAGCPRGCFPFFIYPPTRVW